MLIKSFLWKTIFLILCTIHLTKGFHSNNRENLARRHPCNSLNRRLEPYIKWTEKLASTQYKVQKDACGHIGSGPACCTNEIFNSYALSLGNDLKSLFDNQFDQLSHLLSISTKEIDLWTKDYLTETHGITISSLETLFGTKEYHTNIHHTLTTLFNILGNHQSSDDVSKSSINLFKQLILSSYRRFMTHNYDIMPDDHLQKCLISKAFDIEALPAQRELLYTLTSTASLIHILRTLFIYIDADIQRLKTTTTLNSHQCLQRYVREALCPICVGISSTYVSSVDNYDNNVNEPLCENDCHYVIKTCFDQTNNPYIAFALIAQGYSNVTKQIQESVVELKLVERLSKLHIYLYDMVVNATNNRDIHMKLQSACPDSNGKPFSPIVSLSPIINERRELVTQWNESLHAMFNQVHTTIDNLNINLTTLITTNICSNSKYAVNSNRCTQIDQHTPGNLSQWPHLSVESNAPITSNINIVLTRNQLDDLQKKMTPIQQIIESFRPKKKNPLLEHIPVLDYPDTDTNDNEAQPLVVSSEIYEDNESDSLTEQIYKGIDRQTNDQLSTESPDKKNVNHSKSMTYSITSYSIVFVMLIIHRIMLTNK